MAVDEMLNARMRDALGGLPGISEKKMMGGVCFLMNGNMIGGANRTKQGEPRLMFRVGKDNKDAAEQLPGAIPMVHGGRSMGGLYYVDNDLCDDAALAQWVGLALSFVGDLPAK